MTDEIPVHPVQTTAAQGSRQISGRGYAPQAVTLAAYEVYCHVFRPQEALVTGECRGGFGTGELIALLYARSFPKAEWKTRFHEGIRGQKGI